MLIPADSRSIFDAREPPHSMDSYHVMDDDRLSDPFGAAPQTHGPTVSEATDPTVYGGQRISSSRFFLKTYD